MDVALQQVRDPDSEKKQQAKHYHAKDRPIAEGDAVWFHEGTLKSWTLIMHFNEYFIGFVWIENLWAC